MTCPRLLKLYLAAFCMLGNVTASPCGCSVEAQINDSTYLASQISALRVQLRVEFQAKYAEFQAKYVAQQELINSDAH